MDQGFTPYLSVAVNASTRVPREFVKDNEIVLNVGTDATNALTLGNDEISFQARFSGRVFPVVVPIERVAAIYARENGQGMTFEVEDVDGSTVGQGHKNPSGSLVAADDTESKAQAKEAKRAHLTRIK